MKVQLQKILDSARKEIASAKPEQYEDLRVKYLGRKAELSLLLRKLADLSPEEKRKARCRMKTHRLLKRGVIKRGPCQTCGWATVEAHHPDYGKPRLVIWLCDLHHREEHRVARFAERAV